jgi:glycerol-3-phosphate cytidylyltransferase
MSRLVLTYGTFDLLHYGHISLLLRARALGDRLAIGLSSEGFNAIKGKKAAMDYETRRQFLLELRCVDEVFPEDNWEQKVNDVARLKAHTFVMGHDWEGKFDFLKSQCNVVYLPRTEGVSSTELRALRERVGG